MFILGIPLFLPVAILLILSNCNNNSTGSQVSFHPGTFKGTYKIIQHWQSPNEVLKVDTMMFSFIVPDTFRMRLAPEDQEQRFCEANGKYIFGMDSLKISSVTIYPQTCAPEEKPQADFRYYIIGGDIVFKTSDTALYREIVLWTR
jgi:hypothetical protein